MFKSPLDPDKAATNGNVVEDILLRETDDGCDIRRYRRRVMRFVDMVRVDEERFRHAADRELLAVAVKDRTAQGLDTELIATLVAHALRKCIALYDLQIGIAKGQYDKNRKHEEGNTSYAPLYR